MGIWRQIGRNLHWIPRSAGFSRSNFSGRCCLRGVHGCLLAASRHPTADLGKLDVPARSEEHTSELQSLMRISYAVFCLKKKKKQHPLENRQIISSYQQQYKLNLHYYIKR